MLLIFFLMRRPPPISTCTYTLFPYTTLFRSACSGREPIGYRLTQRNWPRLYSRAVYRFPLVQCPCLPNIRSEDAHMNRYHKTALTVALLATLPLVASAQSTLAEKLQRWQANQDRSEERRVGKECVGTCRYRWSPDH